MPDWVEAEKHPYLRSNFNPFAREINLTGAMYLIRTDSERAKRLCKEAGADWAQFTEKTAAASESPQPMGSLRPTPWDMFLLDRSQGRHLGFTKRDGSPAQGQVDRELRRAWKWAR